ncbi:MarR family winged helix-turn-helix transcriptional regulator [Aurantiacibacter xanthus]|nr:MarR family transcriptional regulator [Aurantiacibacter xanthus]
MKDVSSPNEGMNDWLGRHLRRASNAVLKNLNREFEPYDFRVTLFSVMWLIHEHPGSSGAQLSEYLAVPRSNMVVLLRELEARGLIERGDGPTKSRAQAFRLSKKGKKLMVELEAAHDRHLEYVNSKLDPEERRLLRKLLQRLWQEED